MNSNGQGISNVCPCTFKHIAITRILKSCGKLLKSGFSSCPGQSTGSADNWPFSVQFCVAIYFAFPYLLCWLFLSLPSSYCSCIAYPSPIFLRKCDFFPAQVRCPVLACTVAIHHPWCLMAWLFCQVLDNPSVSAIPDWWARIGTLSWNGMWLSLAWMDQHEKQMPAVHIWLHRAKRHMQALLPSHVTFCFCRDGICCSKFKSLWSQRVFRANLWQAVLPQV